MVRRRSCAVSNHEATMRFTILRDAASSQVYAGCVYLPAWPLLMRKIAGAEWRPGQFKRLFCRTIRPSFVLQLEEHRQRKTVDHFRFVERDKFRLVQDRVN